MKILFPKGNIAESEQKAQVEFELAYFDVAVQLAKHYSMKNTSMVCHYTTGTFSTILLKLLCCNHN